MEDDGAAVVTVRRTGKAECTVSINYATYDETASAGDDYVETKGTLTFGPGVTKHQVRWVIRLRELVITAQLIR